MNDAFTELKNQLKEFFIHKRKQAGYMSDLVSKWDEENAVLQVDFSENAAIASQFEIQSAHWNHGQPLFSQLMFGYQIVRVRVYCLCLMISTILNILCMSSWTTSSITSKRNSPL